MRQSESTHKTDIASHISAKGTDLHTLMSYWVYSNVSSPFHIVHDSARFTVSRIIGLVSRNQYLSRMEIS
jgi:hypothetical protein